MIVRLSIESELKKQKNNNNNIDRLHGNKKNQEGGSKLVYFVPKSSCTNCQEHIIILNNDINLF